MNRLFIEPELSQDKKIFQRASYVRKKIKIQKKIKRAIIRFSACGMYKAYINGKKVDDQVFLPGRTSYEYRLQFQEYDISELLNEGENVIAAIIGNGWYREQSGFISFKESIKKLKFMCLLQLEYADGSREKIVSDKSWKASQDGPLRRNNMKEGEEYDARMEMPGWNMPGYDDTKWHEVKETFYQGTMISSEGERIIEHEHFHPKRILRTTDGSEVLDFGQNIAGYVEFEVNGPEGTEVELICGETLDENGNFTLKNLNFKKNKKTGCYPQTIKYILKEGQQRYKPFFSVQGFRYVKLINWPEPVKAEKFSSIAIYSNMEQTGNFVCSNLKINQLIENSRWSAKGNFLDIPTDCPTRERAGWTGDIMVYSVPATYQMDTYRFLKKWLKDVILEQGEDGRIKNIVPEGCLPTFMDGAAGWADVIVKLPWILYQFYGKKEILEMAYPSIQKHISFMEKRAKKRKWRNLFKGKHWKWIIDKGFHWGEWLEPGSSLPKSALKGLLAPDKETATAYFAWSVNKASEISHILGKEHDALRYEELYKKICEAYQKEFLSEKGIKSERQCRYVRPIALELVDEQQKKRLVRKLNQLVIQNHYHIGTGFLSTPHICSVLSDYGYVNTAYALLENEEAPGWLYEVKKGATTTWENWLGIDEKNKPKNSLNHYSAGSVIGWLYSRVAGIRPLEPGFERILIAPVPGGSLDWVNCSYKSQAGKIISKWNCENGRFHLSVTTPRTTKVILPDESVHEVEAGTYEFSCGMKKSL